MRDYKVTVRRTLTQEMTIYYRARSTGDAYLKAAEETQKAEAYEQEWKTIDVGDPLATEVKETD